MPGYKIERFENLSENERDRFSCSLCQNILCCPLVAQCCQQLFCEECIKDWLKNNNFCPYDGKTLASSGMSLPSRKFLDMLGELKINCDYNDNGCKELVLLENLTKHTVECQCRFNVEMCKQCLCEIQDKSSHDCIKTLLEINRKANEELELLKDSAKLIKPIAQTFEELAETKAREDSLQSEISEMKIEIKNNLKTIQELKTQREKLQNTIQEYSNRIEQQYCLKTSSFRISELEVFKQARRCFLNPEIIGTDMNRKLKKRVLTIVGMELVKIYMSGDACCKCIEEKLNTELGSSITENWHCTASKQTVGNPQNMRHFIEIKFGELYLVIYKSRCVGQIDVLIEI